MNSTNLRQFIEERQLEAEIIYLPQHTPTVERAAEALGTTVERIVKTLVFIIAGRPLLVIANGNGKVDIGKLAALVGVGKKKVKLAGAEAVLALTGFEVGTMPPFGHREKLRTLLERRVLELPEVFAGGGEVNAMLRVRPDVICSATGAEIVDVMGEP